MDPNLIKHMLSIALAHYARNPVGLNNFTRRMSQMYGGQGGNNPYFNRAIGAMGVGDVGLMSHLLNNGISPYIPS